MHLTARTLYSGISSGGRHMHQQGKKSRNFLGVALLDSHPVSRSCAITASFLKEVVWTYYYFGYQKKNKNKTLHHHFNTLSTKRCEMTYSVHCSKLANCSKLLPSRMCTYRILLYCFPSLTGPISLKIL